MARPSRLRREEFVASNRLAHVVLTTIPSTVSDRVFLSLRRTTIFVSSREARHAVASHGIPETAGNWTSATSACQVMRRRRALQGSGTTMNEMQDAAADWRVRWRGFFAELIGTALLVLGGLSVVIVIFGDGSPMASLVPNEPLRMALSAFLFGTIGSVIAVSWIGKESGAHLNPAVTMAFWLIRKLDLRAATGYISAQLLGASAGALPLLAWGSTGRSVAFGATIPGEGYSTTVVLMGEILTTFGLVVTLCVFLGFPHLRRWTPLAIPFLYAVMVPLEAPISGTSTNPARTLGPALISGRWDGWWIYWLGPMLGMLIAVVVCSRLARRVEVAKLYHFESDRRRLFHRMAGSR